MSTTERITSSTLAHFTGSEGTHFDSMSDRMGYYYTDGVSFLNANGCGWLISDMIIKLKMDRKCQNVHSVKFKPSKTGGGSVIYYTTNEETGESVRVSSQRYDSTSIDIPLTFFISETLHNKGHICNLLMLSSEY